MDVTGILADATIAADRGPNQVPGVVLTGVVIGVLLMWAAIRGMFGKKK
jgi:hypothetical protein